MSKYPILLGGLLKVGTAPLVAAVSEAGGFGILGAGAWNQDELKAQIDQVRKLTDKPFGVNIVVRSPARRRPGGPGNRRKNCGPWTHLGR